MVKIEKDNQNCPECGYPSKAGHALGCKLKIASNEDSFDYSESQEHAKEAQQHLLQTERYIRETQEYIEYLIDHRKFAETVNATAQEKGSGVIYDILEIDKDIEKARLFLSELESDRVALQELNTKAQENNEKIKKMLRKTTPDETVN